MTKSRKRRKSGLSVNGEDAVQDEDMVGVDVRSPKKKSRPSESKDRVEKKRRDKKSTISNSSPPETTNSKGINLGSLQSIFADKEEVDGAFTLFGGELVSNLSLEVAPAATIHEASQITTHLQKEQQVLYFFPHYDFPEKNDHSLFSASDEPFFHNRTDEEKRRIWDETKYELTQDWKKRRKAAMKLKRRREIRRKF